MNTLVHLHVVRAARHLTAEGVFELVDVGALLWVFNFAAEGSRRRHLRFLDYEVASPKETASLTVDAVIDSIIPPARNSSGRHEIRRLFNLGHATALRLVRRLGGKNSAVHWRVQRSTLAQWLRQRWVGGNGQ